MNALGAYFTHGPAAGTFCYETYVRFPLPKGLPAEQAHRLAQTPAAARGVETHPESSPRLQAAFAARAAQHQVEVSDFGVINGEVLVAFLWKLGGRPDPAPDGWQRARPLHVVLDNYSVHKSAPVQAALPALDAAGIHLVYLPAYSPELSRIEPVWHVTKYFELPVRSFAHLGDLLHAVQDAFSRQAVALHAAARERTARLLTGTP